MGLSSNVTTTLNLCTLASVLSCLVFLLLFNKNDQFFNFWAATTSPTSLKVESTQVKVKAASTLSSPPPPPPPISTMVAKPVEVSQLSPPPKVTVFVQHSGPPFNFSISNESPPIMVVAKPSINVNTPENALDMKLYHTEEPNISYAKNFEIQAKEKVKKKCNIYDGKWVYKPDGKPSYMASQCPFMEEKMSCQRNKRPDMEFEKWSWQANDCDIPLLNGTDMVEKFKNKRVILVGDSLNRNMWESLSCILYSNIPDASSKAHIQFEGAHLRVFLKAKEEYNFTVEFFWTPYLVEHNTNHSSGKKVLVLDKLSSNSVSWIGADIMIFNSGMHWIQLPPKKGWELYEYNGKLIKDMKLHIAYKRGMQTWARWVEKNVDPKKTTIFFRSVSAEHLNKKRNQWCYGKTKPIMDESYVSSFPYKVIRSIEDVIKGMKNSKVKYLNITKLSQYRIDAHPSIFRYNDWKIRAKRDFKSLTSTADCGHWCLPGIPDTWNRMLYVSLYFDVSL